MEAMKDKGIDIILIEMPILSHSICYCFLVDGNEEEGITLAFFTFFLPIPSGIRKEDGTFHFHLIHQNSLFFLTFTMM